jgi:hypothetical protein
MPLLKSRIIVALIIFPQAGLYLGERIALWQAGQGIQACLAYHFGAGDTPSSHQCICQGNVASSLTIAFH